MGHPTKIATCCYCGTRAALVLKGKDRHELACASCGAPLHDMKMLRKDREVGRSRAPSTSAYHETRSKQKKPKKSKPAKAYRQKRRKGLMHKIFEEAFDAIEDIFD